MNETLLPGQTVTLPSGETATLVRKIDGRCKVARWVVSVNGETAVWAEAAK